MLFGIVTRFDKLFNALLVPVLIGEGNFLYPAATGLNKTLSNAILKAKVARLIFSKQSLTLFSSPKVEDTTKNCISNNDKIIFAVKEDRKKRGCNKNDCDTNERFRLHMQSINNDGQQHEGNSNSHHTPSGN